MNKNLGLAVFFLFILISGTYGQMYDVEEFKKIDDYEIYIDNKFERHPIFECQVNHLIDEDIDGFLTTHLRQAVNKSVEVTFHLTDKFYHEKYMRFFSLQKRDLGRTIWNPFDNKIDIIINPIVFTEEYSSHYSLITIIHEIYHVSIFTNCFMQNSEGHRNIQNCYNDIFDENITSEYELNNHHHIMVNYLIDDIQKILNQYYGIEDSKEIEYLSYVGLSQYTYYFDQYWYTKEYKILERNFNNNRHVLADKCGN